VPVSVSDTGPLSYLIQIDAASNIRSVFSTLMIPPAVHRELSHHNSPSVVRDWVSHMPDWCRVVELEPRIELTGRHAGEREAILLCKQTSAEFVLVDDQEGRAEARRSTSAKPIGTIGVLYEASLLQSEPSLAFEQWITRLRTTNFYFSASLDRAIADLRASVRKK